MAYLDLLIMHITHPYTDRNDVEYIADKLI
jgi:hypothetical protein